MKRFSHNVSISFCSVVVITFASHAKGRRFDPGQKQIIFFYFYFLFRFCFHWWYYSVLSKLHLLFVNIFTGSSKNEWNAYPGSLVGVSTPEPLGFVTAISAWPLPCGPFIRTNSQRVCGPAPLNRPNVILCANLELILDCCVVEREQRGETSNHISCQLWTCYLLLHRKLFSVHHIVSSLRILHLELSHRDRWPPIQRKPFHHHVPLCHRIPVKSQKWKRIPAITICMDVYLVEIVDHKANVWIGHIFAIAFGIHFSSTRRRIHFLWVPSQYLQLFWRGACANGQRERIVELMYDKIEIDCLFPINIRIANGQFPGILAVDIDFRFILWHMPWRAFHMFLSYEKQQVVWINVLFGFGLKKKVSHE